MTDAPGPAPAHWEADVAVRDGRTVRIRPISADDGPRLAAFHRSLSDETVYFRFFAPYPELTERDVVRFTHVDHVDRVALVATVGGELVGVGRYDRVDERDAEVAFVVRDDHQGRGLGSVLLEHLAAAARERGVRRFVAEVLPTNRRMLATFEEAGYHPSHHLEDGVVMLSFDIEPSESSEAVRAAREHRAEARSVASLVAPESVCVIGAGRDPTSLGHRLLHHLVEGGFTGRITAVNRGAALEGTRVRDVPTYASVLDVPDAVRLAVISVPAEDVLEIVDQCGAAGVAGLLVVSSGFAEAGPEGRERQRVLVRRARGLGMRVIGPNALGIVNTDVDVAMNASLAPTMPGRAPIGFFCQSGSLGGTILARAVRRGLGVSTFVSAGNRADVSGNDLLQFWEDDPATDVVLLYLESLGNPRKFTRIARRLGRSKPVVAMRTGRSTQLYPLGHTIRRTQLPPAAIDSMFRQAGIIETDSLSQLFDVAGLLACQPLPAGRRVAVVGNSDALSVLASDACDGADLVVVGEPTTLRHDCTPEQLAEALARVLGDPGVDSVVVTHVPMLGIEGGPWEQVVARTAVDGTKPVVAVLVAAEDESGLIGHAGDGDQAEHGSVPFYGTVEEAVRALQRVTRYAEWRASPLGELPELDGISESAARAVVAEVLEGAAPAAPPATGAVPRDIADTDVIPVIVVAGPDPLAGADPTADVDPADDVDAAADRRVTETAGTHGSDAGAADAGEAVVTSDAATTDDLATTPYDAATTDRAATPDGTASGASEASAVEVVAVDEVLLFAEDPSDPLSRLLAAYDIHVWPVVPVSSEDDAMRAAAELGFPVVLKTLDPRFASRTDLGAVRLNVENERAVRTAYLSMVASLDPDAARHLVVQRMATPGVACVVGSSEDPLFGPVVSFGLAGVVPELLGDRGYRIPPLSDVDAHDLVRAPGAAPILDGVGGTPPVDQGALEQLLLRVGVLADEVPELADLRLEPVVVNPDGLAVLGARAVLRRAAVRVDTGVRRLGS